MYIEHYILMNIALQRYKIKSIRKKKVSFFHIFLFSRSRNGRWSLNPPS